MEHSERGVCTQFSLMRPTFSGPHCELILEPPGLPPSLGRGDVMPGKPTVSFQNLITNSWPYWMPCWFLLKNLQNGPEIGADPKTDSTSWPACSHVRPTGAFAKWMAARWLADNEDNLWNSNSGPTSTITRMALKKHQKKPVQEILALRKAAC